MTDLETGCLTCCYNHHTLVSNVYPTDINSETPNSSALSLLLFYAASKPQKLPKMGALLEKRALQDLKAKRSSRVKVLLQIVESLVKDCSQNLNLFSKSILRILTEILASDSVDLLPRACQSFSLFNEFFPKEVGLGPVVMEFYSKIIATIIQLSKTPLESSQWRERRKDGLDGLLSVCLADQLFKKAAMERYGVAMVPGLLINLTGTDEATLGIISNLPSMSPYKGQPELSHITLKQRAQETLKALFTNLPSSSFKPVLEAVLKYLDESGSWPQTEFVLETIKLVHTSTASTNHYILLASLLDRFKAVPGKLSLQERLSLIACLSYMVIQGGNAITLAHLELLEIFVKHLQGGSPTQTEETRKEKDEFTRLLITSTGNLILSLSYPNQLNDMTHYLISRLFEAEHKKPVLECVHALLSVRLSLMDQPNALIANDKGSSIVTHAPISFDLLKPVLSFYNDDHWETRALVFGILDVEV